AETGTLPAGVTFVDHGDGTATLAGVPVAGTASAYPLTLTATNGVAPDATIAFTLTVEAAGTATALTSSDSASVVGQVVTYTATVTPPPDGGSVAFADGGTPIAACASQPVTAGQATCQVTYTAPGNHAITATYSGDSSFKGSDAGLTQAVGPAATSLTLTSQAASVATNCDPRHGPRDCGDQPRRPADRLGGVCAGSGDSGPDTVSRSVYVPSGPDVSILCQPVTFTATVALTAPGAGAPTGTVTFTDGSSTLGTASLSATGTATLTTDNLPAGPQAITATYGGDTDFQGCSAILTQHVEYIFVGLLPPFDRHDSVDARQTLPVTFMLLDAQGRPVRGAKATLLVNGNPAVPQRHLNQGDAFREVGGRYQYDLKLGDQGVSSGTAQLTIVLDDGTTHAFSLTVRSPDRH
ncbi:MAG TPA: Ig-like domain-containing protein, partial [Bacillota bacterium]|nr:Ig-like domain-containing protein [Bacillota bacterium]